MPARPRLLIRTPGYWPLPPFRQLHDGKKWLELEMRNPLSEKESEYSIHLPSAWGTHPILILEAEITKALPKKVHVFIGKKKFILSRWIGGLYSNLRASSSQRAVRAFYTAIAPLYRYHVEPGRDKQLGALVGALAQALAASPALQSDSSLFKVLDASAGDCTLARAVAAQKLAFDLYASDSSPAMLALGSDTLPPERRVVASASRLPFPASSFDAVLHTYSNLHPADRRFFRSFYRVLKPGGLLLYHPVKAPGEQWPTHFDERVRAALGAAGFSHVERASVQAQGARRVSTLVFYLARR